MGGGTSKAKASEPTATNDGTTRGAGEKYAPLVEHSLDELLALCLKKAKKVRMSETEDFTKRELTLSKEINRLLRSDMESQDMASSPRPSIGRESPVVTPTTPPPVSPQPLSKRTFGTQTELIMVSKRDEKDRIDPNALERSIVRSEGPSDCRSERSRKKSLVSSDSSGTALSRTMSIDSFSHEDFDQSEDKVRSQILDLSASCRSINSHPGVQVPKVRKAPTGNKHRSSTNKPRARSFLKSGPGGRVDHERRVRHLLRILEDCADYSYQGSQCHGRVLTEIAKFYGASKCKLYLFETNESITVQIEQMPALEGVESGLPSPAASATRLVQITESERETAEYKLARNALERGEFAADIVEPPRSPRAMAAGGGLLGVPDPDAPAQQRPRQNRDGLMAQPLPAVAGALLLVDGSLTADDDCIAGIAKAIELMQRGTRVFHRAVFQHKKAAAMMALSDHLASCSLETNVTAGIMDHARRIVNAERCSIYLVQEDAQEWSALFQKADGSVQEMQLPVGDDVFVDVLKQSTPTTICCNNTAEEPRFDASIDALTSFTTHNFLCLPLTYENKIQGVAIVSNKLNDQDKPGVFDMDDIELLESFVAFASVALRNSFYYRQMLREQATTRTVLDCVQKVSGCDIRSIGNITSSVIQGAQDLCGADRCAVFLVDKENNQLVATLQDGKEIRVRLGAGSLAGDVCLSGRHVNLANAYHDSRFNQEVDRETGYLTVSLMCYPIHFNNEVIAVAQLINKTDSYGRVIAFNNKDEVLLESFAAFAGITIGNARLFKFAMQSADEAMRLFNLQMKGEIVRHPADEKKVAYANEEEVGAHFQKKVDDEKWAIASSWGFNVHEYDQRSSGLVPLMGEVFKRLDLIDQFHIDEGKLSCFLVTLRKMYRNVPYHNFVHAFDVMQTLTNYLMDDEVQRRLTKLDIFCTIVIGLLHDVDHMGLNNSFHLKVENPFAFVVSASGSKSVLEVHHCNIAVQMLTHQTTNILGGLTKDENKQVFRMLTNAILATDMARHNEVIKEFEDLDGGYDVNNLEHRIKLISILTIIADISNVFKPFHVSRVWGAKISAEFAQSGDHEKIKPKDELLAVEPHTFIQQVSFVKNQIGFMTKMVRPVLVILTKQIPMFKRHLDCLDENVQHWTAMWKTAVLAHTLGCTSDRAVCYRYYYKMKKYSIICRKAKGEKIMVVDVF